LPEVLAAAQRSPFWKPRLEAAGGEFSRLEPLTKEDILVHGLPESHAMLTGPAASAYVFRSGGTTGRPKFSLFSASEFRSMVEPFMLTYTQAGLCPEDRVANVFTCNSLYASFIFVNRCLEELGCLNFPYTMAAPPELVARQWDMFGMNTLAGFPSHLMRVLEAIGPGKVEKVFYAGEHLHDSDRRLMHEQYGVKLVASGGYGAVDTGLMGFQCGHCEGSVHHVLDEHVIIEVVDPDHYAPVPEGEAGLLLITVLDRMLMPILRYVIGDMGRWVPGTCACGRLERRFELLGRGDDVLRIGIANVAHDEVFAALADVASALQIAKERVGTQDQLVLRMELRAEQPSEEWLTARVYEAKPDLEKLVHSGHITPFVFEVLGPGGLERSPLTGKLIRAVDRTR
jgi:phenylacetate-coenzyme A ligase PaaK-like adenylate-forming protein